MFPNHCYFLRQPDSSCGPEALLYQEADFYRYNQQLLTKPVSATTASPPSKRGGKTLEDFM